MIVLQAPDTLFLKDTDGDGKADVRKVCSRAGASSDTHAGPSNLRWGLDNWVWGIVGYSGFRGTVGGERHRSGQGFYRFKPDGSKLEFLRSTEQQLVGRRLQRGRAGLRLDGQRLPERLSADPQPLLRGGSRLVASGAREHRGSNPVLPGDRQGPPGRLSRRVHGRGRPCPLHGPDLSAASTGTRRRSSPSRPGTWSPRSRSSARGATSPTTTAGTCWPATTNGPRRSRPRSGPTAMSGSSTGTTTSSSTTPRRTASRPARATPTRRRCATRPTAGSTASSTRTRTPIRAAGARSRTIPADWSPRSERQPVLADARPAAPGRAWQDRRRARL